MHKSRLLIPALSLIAGVFVLAPPAAAADDPQTLSAEGLRLRREGKDQQALPLFQDALRQHPTPRAYGQLGFCEQALGLWVSAEGHIEEALKHLRDPWVGKNEAALRQSLAFVQSKLGSIELWGTPAGANVSVDGKPMATLPITRPIRAAEGRRIVLIEATGFIADTRIVEVRAGMLAREHVSLVPMSVASLPQPPRAETGTGSAPPPDGAPTGDSPADVPAAAGADPSAGELPSWRRVLPWSLVVGALVAGSVGAWQHIESRAALADFDAMLTCGEDARMRGGPQCQDLYDDYSRSQTRAFVGYGVAGAFGVGAAVFFLLNAAAAPREATASAAAEPRSRIVLGPGKTGLSYSITF